MTRNKTQGSTAMVRVFQGDADYLERLKNRPEVTEGISVPVRRTMALSVAYLVRKHKESK